ncbi:MAG: 4Fe-4S binding protein [Deltaproteobacteria bacterium]|nr:4Fe-4S binding protein [Deltaproteobacteria bacterium]
MSVVYQALAEHLDTLPQRFPTNTGTGLELKVLQHIFSPEEAEMAIQLQPMPELATDIAARIGKDPEETEAFLLEMSKKGLILRLGKPGAHKFMAAPFMVGIMEWQLKRFTKEMIEDLDAFEPYLLEQTWMKGKTRELRTIPIDKTVTDTSEVMPYESAEAIIKSAKHISVADCMCRKISEVRGEPCDRPMEVCLQFGGATHLYVGNGLGRYIDQEEALALLKKGVESALVIQAGSSQNPGGMCMCCGCCCKPLTAYKQTDKPAQYANSNYFAVVDEEACVACGVCEDRCQMDAITVEDHSMVDLDRCIGCGLCVVTCDYDAITMEKKEEALQWVPREDYMATIMDIHKERREA